LYFYPIKADLAARRRAADRTLPTAEQCVRIFMRQPMIINSGLKNAAYRQ
jgi:hypothetical protein